MLPPTFSSPVWRGGNLLYNYFSKHIVEVQTHLKAPKQKQKKLFIYILIAMVRAENAQV